MDGIDPVTCLRDWSFCHVVSQHLPWGDHRCMGEAEVVMQIEAKWLEYFTTLETDGYVLSLQLASKSGVFAITLPNTYIGRS